MQIALKDIANDESILPFTNYSPENYNSDAIPSVFLLFHLFLVIKLLIKMKLSLSKSLEAMQDGKDMLFCCSTSDEGRLVGVVSSVFNVPMVSYLSTTARLADRTKYPQVSILIPIDINEAVAVANLIDYLAEESKIPKYREIGVICTTDTYGISASKELIQIAPEYGIKVITYQQFLRKSTDISIEMNEFKNSNARVFVAVMDDVDSRFLLRSASSAGITGDSFIWICLAGCATAYTIQDPLDGFAIDPIAYEAALGMLAIGYYGYSDTETYRQFEESWHNLDPEIYYYAGPNSNPDIYSQFVYDGLYFVAIAYDKLIKENQIDEEGMIRNFTRFNEVLTEIVYEGCTGLVSLDENGIRKPIYSILNLQNGNNDWSRIGKWDLESGISFTSPILFHDGTTEYPDIDVRTPFAYWSCENGEREVDLTGKKIQLHSPDYSKNPNIDYEYHCDQFIDCFNISDESQDCENNYVALYITFSIITFILILITLLFIGFAIIFGCFIKRRRVRASSPTFLVIICISVIVGYGSTFAWYGKANTVACGFQPWLLGLSVISLISALCAKTFRIWRIFKFPMNRKVITDFELFFLWLVLLIPAVIILILWTLISTPTATLKTIEGEKHYVCDTGGFTGPPGGYIFFAILVAYETLVLLFGGFLSFVTRKVPSLYNESKLIAISIYHIMFLALILIPVVIVLNTVDPFLAWIIRTLGILYVFTATLWFQFVPKILGIFCFDKGSIVKTKELSDIDRRTDHRFSNIPSAVDSVSTGSIM